MQKLTGQGTAFIEIDGYGVEYNLAPGQEMIVDTGYLACNGRDLYNGHC